MSRDEVSSFVFRIVIATVFALIAIGFLGNDSEFLGLVAALVAFSVAVRGASNVIFVLIFTLLPFVVMLALIWSPFGIFENTRFVEWLAEFWYAPVTYLIMILFRVYRHFENRESTWTILSEQYGATPRSTKDLLDYPSARGALTVADDFVPVTAYQIPSGFLVTHPGVTPLLFPWRRIAQVSRSSGDQSKAVLHLKKNSGPALEIEIPWSASFQTKADPNTVEAGT